MADNTQPNDQGDAPEQLSPEETQAALDAAVAENESLKAKVAELEAALAEAKGETEQAQERLHRFEKSAFVDKLARNGHLEPARKAWALKQSLDSLKEYEADSIASPKALSKRVEEKSVHVAPEVDLLPSLRVPRKKTSPQA